MRIDGWIGSRAAGGIFPQIDFNQEPLAQGDCA
jgi:hypothetical protein